jgi:hypothetical protein
MDSLLESVLNAAALRPAPHNALHAVVAAYDKALKDEETKLPSYLMAALEAARRNC